jgi:hypothetical protein
MQFRKIIRIFAAALILFATLTGVEAQQESEQPISEQERTDAQRVARQFVRRTQQTRDVNQLIRELFLQNFISHFVSGDCECMPPHFYDGGVILVKHGQRMKIVKLTYVDGD